MLHLAVAEENAELCSTLLETGELNVNEQRPPGISALHVACVVGNVDIMKRLLQAGADIG